MVAAVATVLVFSLRSLSREKSRLLQGFAGTQQTAARELASDLDDRLRDVEEDARVIATLVKEARVGTSSERKEKAQTMLASFRAMATVVRHYRSLALFGPDDQLRLSAIDPTEDDPTAAALISRSRTAANVGHAAPLLTGPVEAVTGRYFYFYRMPVDAETVVITIEAPRFLQSALRPVPDGRIVVTDPGATQWTGCGANARCLPRAPSSHTAEEGAWSEANGTAWVGGSAAESFGLPRQDAAAAWVTTGSAALGAWRVLLLTSAGMIQAREKALLRQVLLTGIGLVVAIGLVGVLIVRQQRFAAALAERLRTAEALRALELQLIRAEKLATTGVLAAGIAHEVGTPLGIIRARAEISDRRAEATRHQARSRGDRPADRSDLVDDPAGPRFLSGATGRDAGGGRRFGVAVDDGAPRSPLSPAAGRPARRCVAPICHRWRPTPISCSRCWSTCSSTRATRARREGDRDRRAQTTTATARVRWEIRDNGCGIATEHLLAVFDPFFTTKKRGEGTGLGFAVAAQHRSQSRRRDRSPEQRAGEGTTVDALLLANRAPRGHGHVDAAERPGGRRRTSRWRNAVADELRDAGFEAEVADGGAAAIEAASSAHRPTWSSPTCA